jgi:DNA-binding beta-propeller fold protein YncE
MSNNRMQTFGVNGLRRVAAMLAAAVLAGCAGAPSQVPQAQGTAFYPPLPNPPRIQHLKTLTGERDLGAPASGLAKFVLGDDTTAQQLKQPYGVAMFQGKLYVVDSRAPGLAIFDLAKQRFELMTGAPNGRMKRPINITIDADGTKYVTDTGRDQVLVFDRDDRFVAAYGAEGQFKPVDTAIAGERLYVVDIQHHQVHVLEKRTGKLLFTFGSAGSQVGELYHPTNIAIGADGDVYVVETSNFRVQRFTAAGKPLRMYGQIGAERGNFSRPKGIALDRNGRLYVGDSAFQNVQIFDNDGRLLLFFGQPGGDAEGLNLPAGVTIDYDNVQYFRSYADPRFNIEYLIFVVSQFGPNKVDVFGYGKMYGMDYASEPGPAAKPSAKPAS